MKLSQYLKDHLILVFLPLLFFLFLLIILLNTHFNYDLILVISITFFSGYIIIIAFEYLKKKKYYDMLNSILEDLDHKYLFSEVLPVANSNEETILENIFYDINNSMSNRINELDHKITDYQDFIDLWIHEVKIPLATLKLMSENENREFLIELNRLDNDIDKVLYYLKSNNVESDYIIKDVNLKDSIEDIISNERYMFIKKQIKVEMNNLDINVKSDLKWLNYIIRQIISNSIKYTNRNGIIKIYTVKKSNSIELVIEDNGTGISKEDLPRVFDKGFTGTNGRAHYEASGIGLFLCLKLCQQLHHNIRIESDTTTRAYISFPKGQFNDCI